MNILPIIREIKKSEIPFLDEMLYDAIFIPEGEEKLPKEIIRHPELARYITNFGREGDYCLVAEVENRLVGAIWIRFFTTDEKGYGFVDLETPELSMAIDEEYRNKGIGTLLLNEMIKKLIEQKYNQVSLSVDKLNYAYNLYCKFGFEVIDSTEKSATMIKRLINSRSNE